MLLLQSEARCFRPVQLKQRFFSARTFFRAETVKTVEQSLEEWVDSSQ